VVEKERGRGDESEERQRLALSNLFIPFFFPRCRLNWYIDGLMLSKLLRLH
jgi:hypothetical protein